MPLHEDPRLRAQTAMSQLMRIGFTPVVLMKLATFQVQWTMFETMLEATIWAMKGEDPRGIRPSTDAKQASTLIEMFEQHADKLPSHFQDTVTLAARTASLLLRYRNGISHGFVLPDTVGGPGFLSNPMWHGEKRKRQHADSLTDEESLDLALYAVLAVREVQHYAKESMSESSILTADVVSLMQGRSKTARSMAAELVYRVQLANHEKN